MKKLFLSIIVLGLLLQGCASPGGVFGGGNPEPEIPSQIKDIKISWHFNSPPKNEIIQIANNHCKQVKQDLISDNLRLIYKANGMSIVNSEWDKWFFDCKKDEICYICISLCHKGHKIGSPRKVNILKVNCL